MCIRLILLSIGPKIEEKLSNQDSLSWAIKSLGVIIHIDKYDDYKDYFENGLRINFSDLYLNLIFARFHGMIVEYNKNVS